MRRERGVENKEVKKAEGKSEEETLEEEDAVGRAQTEEKECD